MAGLDIKNVYKKFPNGFVAIKDLSLTIEDKEFLILVGPSGCGKSTMLRMIAGLEEITSGEVWIDDVLCNDVAPKDRDIAMVFQNYALYPHMTVYDNMAFGLKLRKMPKDEIDERVTGAAKILGIDENLDRKPKALSGGQRQRVAMGRAIVREPKVFLMDEPLSNLDAKLRVQMRTEISKLHERLATTFVYVTHDQTEALTLGSRIVVLKAGEIMQVDAPTKLYTEPDNLFVGSFIGSPQMNFLDAKATKKGDDVYLTVGKSEIILEKEKADKIIEGGYIDKDVIMGIRPENMADMDTVLEVEEDQYTAVTGNVEVTELLGAETYLYMIIEGNNVTARVDPSCEAGPGDDIVVGIRKTNIHVFDAETEQTITN